MSALLSSSREAHTIFSRLEIVIIISVIVLFLAFDAVATYLVYTERTAVSNLYRQERRDLAAIESAYQEVEASFIRYAFIKNDDNRGTLLSNLMAFDDVTQAIANNKKYIGHISNQTRDQVKRYVNILYSELKKEGEADQERIQNAMYDFNFTAGLFKKGVFDYAENVALMGLEEREHLIVISVLFINIFCGALILIFINKLRELRKITLEKQKIMDLLEPRVAAIESIQDGIVILDADLRMRYINPASLEIFHYGHEGELIGESFSKLYNETQYDVIKNIGVSSLDTKKHEQWESEILGLKKTGVEFNQYLYLSPLNDGGYVAVIRDQDEMLEYINIANERLSAIEVAGEGLGVIDPDGSLSYANKALLDIYGITEDRIGEFLGKSWINLYPLDGQVEILNLVLPVVEEKGFWSGEAEILNKKGEKVIAFMSLNRLRNGGMVGTARDITSRKRAEEEKDMLQKQFYQVQKLEAIGRLSGGIAHDFNNVLASMLGYTEFLMDDLKDGTPEHDFATKIMKGGMQARQMIDQILTFSRKNETEHNVFDFVMVLDDVQGMLQGSMPASVNVVFDLGVDEVLIDGNPTQINQTIMNLCVNAVDAMDEKGDLIVSLDKVPEDRINSALSVDDIDNEHNFYAPRIHIVDDKKTTLTSGQFLQNQDYICLSVKDSGSGIPRDVMEHIFEPFFTTKSQEEGTGLGLATVQGIVIAHKGLITIESVVGMGTEFKLYFPAASQSVAIVTKNKEAISEAGTGHVLVVEDDEVVSDMMAQMLRRMGYDVTLKHNGEDAVDHLRENPSAYRAVITDFAMPGMNGIDLANTVNEDFPDMPIILISGYTKPKVKEAMKENKAIKAFVKKPISSRKLSQTLRRVMTA